MPSLSTPVLSYTTGISKQPDRNEKIKEEPDKRVFPWSQNAAKDLANRLKKEFIDPISSSKIIRSITNNLPLPKGGIAEIQTAQVDNRNNTEIRTTLTIPGQKTENIHSPSQNKTYRLSSQNNLAEKPGVMNEQLASLLTSDLDPTKKIDQAILSGLVNIQEIGKIREHFLDRYNELQKSNPSFVQNIKNSEQALRMKSIIDNTDVKPEARFNQIQAEQLLPGIVNQIVYSANQDFPEKTERIKPGYFMVILDQLNQKISKTIQEVQEKLPEREANKLFEINTAIVDMLKSSEIQRTLKLNSHSPEEKISIIKDKELIPKTELDQILLKAKGSSEEAIKLLKKDAQYHTRQITKEEDAHRVISTYEKRDGLLEPFVLTKTIYLGDPKANDTASINMRWHIPNASEKIQKTTQNALSIIKGKDFETSINALEALVPPVKSENLTFQAIQEGERIKKIKVEAQNSFSNKDTVKLKEKLKELFEIYKKRSNEPEELEKMFNLAFKHLETILTTFESDKSNVINKPETLAEEDPSSQLSQTFKDQSAAKNKMELELQNLETMVESAGAFSTVNVMNNLFSELTPDVQEKSKTRFEKVNNALEDLSRTAMNLAALKTKETNFAEIEEMNKVLDSKQEMINQEIDTLAEIIAPNEESRLKLSELLKKLEEKEISRTEEEQEKLLKESTLPEHQTNEEILKKYGNFAELAMTLGTEEMKEKLGAQLIIDVKEGDKVIKSDLKYLTDTAKVSNVQEVIINEYRIPIPGANGTENFIHTDNKGNRIEVENGFVNIRDNKNTLRRKITPLGVDMHFHPEGTKHKPVLGDYKYKSSVRAGYGKYAMQEPGNRKMRENTARLYRDRGIPMKADTNENRNRAHPPVETIETKFGEVFHLDPFAYYNFQAKNDGSLVAYEDDPNKIKDHNFKAPKVLLYRS